MLFVPRALVVLCPILTSSLHVQSSVKVARLARIPTTQENDRGNTSRNDHCPSIFVAVMTSLDNRDLRTRIRNMWNRSGERYPSPLVYRFALCTADGRSEELLQEQDDHGDLLFMNCEEGYLGGALTRKVKKAMEHFYDVKQNFDLFMKIDDDTFISAHRLCDFMSHQVEHGGIRLDRAYVGVFEEGPENMKGHPVIRDPGSEWYEPPEKYPEEKYPVAAKGGPGYILSKSIVEEFINRGIPQYYELNNEDKAVGYWITKLYDPTSVHYVNIPGTDGYEEHSKWIVTTGKFHDYPYIVHHHLDGDAIKCLHEVDFAIDPSQPIDHCLHIPSESLIGKRPEEHVRIHMPY